MNSLPVSDQTGENTSKDVIQLNAGEGKNQTIIEGNATAQGDFVGRDKIGGYNINANTVNLYQGSQNNFATAKRIGVKLVLDRDLKSYTSEEQNRLLEAVRHLLTSDIAITGIEPGSVIVHIELPADQVDKLSALVKAGVFDEFGVKSIEFDTQLSLVSPSSTEISLSSEGPESTSLSSKQENILNFLITFIQEQKYPPTVQEISVMLNVPRSTVTRTLNKLEDFNFLERYRDISRGIKLNWNRLVKYGITTTLQKPLQVPFTYHNDIRILKIPVLGSIAAGGSIQVETIDPTHSEEFIEIATSMLGNPERLFALRVRGDSLIDASILDGDTIILRNQETAKDGNLVAAWVDGDEATLKYLFHEGRQMRLQPANPQYKPVIRPIDKVRINGIAVAVIRVLEYSTETQPDNPNFQPTILQEVISG